MAHEKACQQALEKLSHLLRNEQSVVGLGIQPVPPESKAADSLGVAVYVLPNHQKTIQLPDCVEVQIDGEMVSVRTRVIEEGPMKLE